MHTNLPAIYGQAEYRHVPYHIHISLIDQAITSPSDTHHLFRRECCTLNPVVSMNYGQSGLLEIKEKRGNRTLIVHLIAGDVVIMAGMFHDKIKPSEPALSEWETRRDANVSIMRGRTLPKREFDALDKDIETFKLAPETMRMRQCISIEFIPETAPKKHLTTGREVGTSNNIKPGWSTQQSARCMASSHVNRIAPSPEAVSRWGEHDEHMSH
jgi:hypothetical protein